MCALLSCRTRLLPCRWVVRARSWRCVVCPLSPSVIGARRTQDMASSRCAELCATVRRAFFHARCIWSATRPMGKMESDDARAIRDGAAPGERLGLDSAHRTHVPLFIPFLYPSPLVIPSSVYLCFFLSVSVFIQLPSLRFRITSLSHRILPIERARVVQAGGQRTRSFSIVRISWCGLAWSGCAGSTTRREMILCVSRPARQLYHTHQLHRPIFRQRPHPLIRRKLGRLEDDENIAPIPPA